MTTVTLTHNAAQARAIEGFKAFMERQISRVPAYGDTVSFEIQTTAFGQTWVTAKTDMKGLGEGNLLRAVSGQYWLALIGKRGAVTIRMAPKSFDQFNGKRAFGYSFATSR